MEIIHVSLFLNDIYIIYILLTTYNVEMYNKCIENIILVEKRWQKDVPMRPQKSTLFHW